ncbi:MAG: sigma-70 family RNA polymerase sigma factor [Verrucomicrobiota bacterium]|jgi:RNA polymerase sigma-70 factor (ECF subfamily)
MDLKSAADEELARQSQAGSLEAFEELVSRYERRIYAFTAQWRCNPSEAREVTQDAFVRAFQAIAQFDTRRPFAPWLFAIARRRCVDLHRHFRPVSEDPLPDLPDLDDPAEVLARREEGENVWRLARRHLGDGQYQAIWLRYAEDMNVAEIAQALGKTQTHVKVLLFRARQKLAGPLRRAGRETPALAPATEGGSP